VNVNGQNAERYSDFTFASPGHTLINGTNTFSIVASNAGLMGGVTNTLNSYLPSTLNFQYDGSGNLTNDGLRSFAYDVRNQLSTVSVAGQWRSEFAYDGLGRKRIEREYTWTGGAWQQTNEVRLVYDGMLVLQERHFDPQLSTNNPQQVVTYTRGLDLSGTRQGAGGIGGLLARSQHSTTNTQHAYYHSDGEGNITALMDAEHHIIAGYLYDPFGRQFGQWGALAQANRMRFSSKPVHAQSGLYDYGFRHYDPNLQRWLTEDPLGEAGGINLYGFVGNSPLNLVDPFGLEITYFYGRQEPSILFPDGSVPYLTGDNFGENLVASFYNAIPLANNLIEKAADPIDQGIAALTDAVANGVTAATGYPEFGEGVRNLGAVAPLLLSKKPTPCRAAKTGAEAERLVIGRGADLVKPGALNPGEFKFSWPPTGAAQTEWKVNSGLLRQEMGNLRPIRDASVGNNGGMYLNAERNLLETRGWKLDKSTSLWMPPTPAP
jgi:RHS repeat-associated protein